MAKKQPPLSLAPASKWRLSATKHPTAGAIQVHQACTSSYWAKFVNLLTMQQEASGSTEPQQSQSCNLLGRPGGRRCSLWVAWPQARAAHVVKPMSLLSSPRPHSVRSTSQVQVLSLSRPPSPAPGSPSSNRTVSPAGRSQPREDFRPTG